MKTVWAPERRKAVAAWRPRPLEPVGNVSARSSMLVDGSKRRLASCDQCYFPVKREEVVDVEV